MLRTLSFLLLSATVQLLVSANVTSQLLVHSPHSLYLKDGYPHTVANFGANHWSESLTQRAYYYDPTSDPKNGTSCRFTLNATTTPFVLLLDRTLEDCNAVRQARSAQHNGAAAVVLMEQKCLCSDTEECEHEDGDCTDEFVPLKDDGSAEDVAIPVVSIRKQDGQAFRKALSTPAAGDVTPTVLMELSFFHEPAFQLDDNGEQLKTDYYVWTTPADRLSRKFWKEWEPVNRALIDYVDFRPAFYLFSGKNTICSSTRNLREDDKDDDDKTVDVCQEFCINKGRYCLTSDPVTNTSGAELVKETLHRACLWDANQPAYNDRQAKQKALDLFFKYVHKFQHECLAIPEEEEEETALFLNDNVYMVSKKHHKHRQHKDETLQDCRTRVYKEMRLDASTIEKCVGDTDQDVKNDLLDEALHMIQDHGVVRYPVSYIQDRSKLTRASSDFLLEALCEELDWAPMVPACAECSQCYGDTSRCVKLGSCHQARWERRDEEEKQRQAKQHQPPHHGHHNPFVTFFKWIFVLACMGGIGYAGLEYYKRQRVATMLSDHGVVDSSTPAGGILGDYLQLGSNDEAVPTASEPNINPFD